ncbi:MAG: RluA family pseudouridine synthase [Myxococcota bacterium]|nr:RluA family pseudouridine synthase [Myxococcota bacterium]
MTTLLQILRAKGLSNSSAKKLLKSGKVRLHGIPTADGGRIVKPEDIDIRSNSPRMIVGRDPVIVHREDGFVVVWKPANYLSVPAHNRRKEYSVISFVRRICDASYAVHRLDEGTSGLMLVATTEATQQILKASLEERKVHRAYLAIAKGHIREKKTINTLFVRNRGDGLRGSAPRGEQNGKRAITHIRPVERLKKATLLEAILDTGRTHQIRIHLSEWGHPIIGDDLYGRIQKGENRLALHAWKLRFPHPTTKKEMGFFAPLADDLERMRRNLSRGS